MVGIAGYGFINGDPYLLLTTWDYDGNGCGYNDTTLDYPYLYFVAPDYTNLRDDAFKTAVCVKSCPTSDS